MEVAGFGGPTTCIRRQAAPPTKRCDLGLEFCVRGPASGRCFLLLSWHRGAFAAGARLLQKGCGWGLSFEWEARFGAKLFGRMYAKNGTGR